MAVVHRYSQRWACVAVAVACSAPLLAPAQDETKVSPQFAKLVLDNAKIRVVAVTAPPGSTLAMHSHPAAYLTYIIEGGKATSTTSDGKVTERELKTGEALWSEPQTHTNKNVGTTTIKTLVVEVKQP